ncbi:nuclear transport factor 2 family protein [Rhizobium sp. NFR03]|uniref:nuclear transport factor 2 family protein n=1 Tax=Rhizobium sp. NFR03 TaxID=1566263 RepID=UPI0008AC71A1|nr:nuclear transport factor 2 family protein [Rhizobium sp. NFR03]SER49295.1 Ketosteroid isomerase-related protein [Rhizobium sp. NFR03]
MTALADTFISALHRLESDRDIDTIANLFANDASVSNPLVSYDDGGVDAAKTFWSHYRDAFDEISSEFRAVTDTDGVAFLEWRSRGSVDGEAFDYGGVSVLEEADGKISSFRTYFDSAQIPRAHSTGGEGTGRNGQTANGGETAKAKPDIELTGKKNGEDDLDTAQREAAEQRAQGGYS